MRNRLSLSLFPESSTVRILFSSLLSSPSSLWKFPLLTQNPLPSPALSSLLSVYSSVSSPLSSLLPVSSSSPQAPTPPISRPSLPSAASLSPGQPIPLCRAQDLQLNCQSLSSRPLLSLLDHQPAVVIQLSAGRFSPGAAEKSGLCPLFTHCSLQISVGHTSSAIPQMATQRRIIPLAMLNIDMTIKRRIAKLWTTYNPKDKKKISYDFLFVDQQMSFLLKMLT